ncbi:TATA box-binding protein-like protein 1 [Sarcoptes scabiei]|uniref:TATA box-binding protein-like 1 n=1 Tax=Sarcoptes scabiei TaxID=52283 RepID=A0A834R2Z1_SARSC|nr:TATA box-binding protein-like protein 1 [Sarcoptes scabiei]
MIATSNFVNSMHNGTVNNTATLTNVSSLSPNGENNLASNQATTTAAIIIANSDSTLLADARLLNCNPSQQQDINHNYTYSTTIINSNDTIAEIDRISDNNIDDRQSQAIQEVEEDEQSNNEETVDITISNVVSNFSVRCHLNLRQIATRGSNVVYKREQSIILMKLRQPQVTASIWSSGKITCTGATTEEQAKCASRKIARSLQKLGFRVKFSSYRVVNVLGACRLPFGIKIHEFSDVHRPIASYEPELHPGVTYRIKDLKATLKIFQTGSITITAPSIRNVQLAVEHIYPLVHEFRKPKPYIKTVSDGNDENKTNDQNKYATADIDTDNDDFEAIHSI